MPMQDSRFYRAEGMQGKDIYSRQSLCEFQTRFGRLGAPPVKGLFAWGKDPLSRKRLS